MFHIYGYGLFSDKSILKVLMEVTCPHFLSHCKLWSEWTEFQYNNKR